MAVFRRRLTLYDVPRHYRSPDRRVAWAILIAIASAIHVAAQSRTADRPSFHVAVGPQEVVLSHEKIIQNKLWSWPDGLLGVRKSGETYTFIGPQGGKSSCHGVDGQPAQAVGTLDDPIRDGITPCMAIENMRNRYTYTGAGPVYKDPSTGMLLLYYHAENETGRSNFWTTIGMAKSTDDGRRWTDLGPIITANQQLSSTTTTDLGGGTYAVVNGYFYVYFRDFLQNGAESYVSVARATVEDVLTAAKADTVAAWNKYYNGAWTEPGLGGRSTNTEASGQHVSWRCVSYNTYLGKWIMVAMARPEPDSANTKLHLFESSDGLSWSGRQQLESDPGSSHYPTIVGLGADPTITDSHFYVYYDAVQAGAPIGDHDWSRRLIILSEASPPPSPASTPTGKQASTLGDRAAAPFVSATKGSPARALLPSPR